MKSILEKKLFELKKTIENQLFFPHSMTSLQTQSPIEVLPQ